LFLDSFVDENKINYIFKINNEALSFALFETTSNRTTTTIIIKTMTNANNHETNATA